MALYLVLMMVQLMVKHLNYLMGLYLVLPKARYLEWMTDEYWDYHLAQQIVWRMALYLVQMMVYLMVMHLGYLMV